MVEINVNIQAVRNDNYALYPLIYQLEQCERTIAVLRWRMDSDNVKAVQIREELTAVCKEIEIIKKKIEDLHHITKLCMEQYIMLENDLEKRAEDFL